MPFSKKGNFIEENVAIILKFCIRDPECPSSFKKIKSLQHTRNRVFLSVLMCNSTFLVKSSS